MKKRAKKPQSTDRVMLTVRIPRALHDELKMQSLRQRTSLQQLVEESLIGKTPRKKPVDTSWLSEHQVELKIKGPLRRHVFYEA